jgi:hypothetical protein
MEQVEHGSERSLEQAALLPRRVDADRDRHEIGEENGYERERHGHGETPRHLARDARSRVELAAQVQREQSGPRSLAAVLHRAPAVRVVPAEPVAHECRRGAERLDAFRGDHGLVPAHALERRVHAVERSRVARCHIGERVEEQGHGAFPEETELRARILPA